MGAFFRGCLLLIHSLILALQVRLPRPRSACRALLQRVTLRHRHVACSIALPALLTRRCATVQLAHRLTAGSLTAGSLIAGALTVGVAHCWGAPCACLWHDRLGITHASLPAAGRIASNHAKLPLSSLPLRSSGERLPCSLAPIFFGAKLCSSCALVRALGIARLTARNPSSPSSLTHASIHLPTPLACQPDCFVVSLQETARHAPRDRTHSHRAQGYRAPSERAPAPASRRAPS